MGKKSRKSNEKNDSGYSAKNNVTPNEDSINKAMAKAETLAQRGDSSGAQVIYNTEAESLRNELKRIESTANDNEDNKSYILFALLARVLGQSGECQASIGNIEGAIADFNEGIDLLSPLVTDVEEDGSNDMTADAILEALASLYLYLGQVMDSEEALESFQKGVTFLERALQQLENKDMTHESKDVVMSDVSNESEELTRPDVDIRKQLCAAYCSIGELYLTDLCDDPNAEKECENAIMKALKFDNDDESFAPDALQALANLRLSQCRNDDATKAMIQVFERMKKGCTILASLVGLGPPIPKDEAREPNIDAASSLPSYEFRTASAKLLLECAAADHSSLNKCDDCCEAALFILGSLLAEDDENIEVWYLIGCACMQFSDPNKEMAKYHWSKALQMMKRQKDILERQIKQEDNKDILIEMNKELSCAKDQIHDLEKKMQNDKMEES